MSAMDDLMAEIKAQGLEQTKQSNLIASMSMQIKIMWGIMASVGGASLFVGVFIVQKVLDVVLK